MTTLMYVKGADRMITAARLGSDGLYVRFADEREGVIPVAELKLPGAPEAVTVPRPHVVEIHLADGRVEELPWDFARQFPRYQTLVALAEALELPIERLLVG